MVADVVVLVPPQPCVTFNNTGGAEGWEGGGGRVRVGPSTPLCYVLRLLHINAYREPSNPFEPLPTNTPVTLSHFPCHIH